MEGGEVILGGAWERVVKGDQRMRSKERCVVSLARLNVDNNDNNNKHICIAR